MARQRTPTSTLTLRAELGLLTLTTGTSTDQRRLTQALGAVDGLPPERQEKM